MKDSLEARLAVLPEIEADLLPYGKWLQRWMRARPCCIRFLKKRYGCSDACMHGVPGLNSDYYYHGTTSPTAETLIYDDEDDEIRLSCDTCHGLWWDSSMMLHPVLLGEFDEETERERLMPV